jgi:dTMP kinase
MDGKDRAMFITFEGIEGSGKSLQVKAAESYLKAKGVACLFTREPGGTGFGLSLRQVLLNSQGAPRESLSELLLYLADRYQHLKEKIEPALRQGIIVISDRYHDATRAYQGAARGVSAEMIENLAKLLGIPEPDGTILLDLDPKIALARARKRNLDNFQTADEGRFENEALSFHRRVREGYLELARRFPDRIRVVSGNGSPEEVFARIKPVLDEWLKLATKSQPITI